MNRQKEIALLAASSMTVMAGATISPALPDIGVFFAHESNAEFWVKLILTLPALFIALGAPVVGWLIDRWRRKPVLLASVILYGAAGASGLYAPTLNTLLLGRIGLGLAVAGIMTCATTLVGDYFAGAARNRFLGLQSAAMSSGGVVFTLLGGFLAEVSWRAPFAVYLLAFVILPLLWHALDEPERVVEVAVNTTPKAVLPWGLLLWLYPLMLACQAIFYLIPVQLPFHLKGLLNTTGAQAGLAMALFNSCAMIAALRYRRLRERVSAQTIFVILFGLIGVGYLCLAQSATYRQVLGSMAIAGTGFGLLMPNISVWLLARAPEELRGRAVGGLTMCIFLGQFLSPFAVAWRTPTPSLAGVYGAGGVVSLFFALCFGAAAWRARNND